MFQWLYIRGHRFSLCVCLSNIDTRHLRAWTRRMSDLIFNSFIKIKIKLIFLFTISKTRFRYHMSPLGTVLQFSVPSNWIYHTIFCLISLSWFVGLLSISSLSSDLHWQPRLQDTFAQRWNRDYEMFEHDFIFPFTGQQTKIKCATF